ncbi:hypothetical protein SUGI_0138700 [Cryptomeria japonica]|uniref:pectinesterase-like n=1 Tax=Cryptomeria japonica TaxID=3369 RepID=UPI00240896CB|nr:pectinesterase-like [Cryptomeria japonica]GLJ10953.1 hypothetical protein SUGI_0138700 [Cryptomeria japonica]
MYEFKGHGYPNPLERARLEEKRQTRKRMIIISISSIVLVAMIIGVGIGVVQSRNGKDVTQSESQKTSMSLKATCDATRYPDTCVSSLSSYPGASNARPQDLDYIAAMVALEKAQQAHVVISNLREQSNDPRQRLALEHCEDFLDDTIEQLNSSSLLLKIVDLRSMKTISDVQTWHSASLSDLETCRDGFAELPANDVKAQVESTTQNLTELVSNSLAIVNKIVDVLGKNSRTRRLLSDGLPSHRGFPAWVSAADRKLLESTKADLVVAADGYGDYISIQDAVDAAPDKSDARFVIRVKAGVYEEYVTVSKQKTMITIIGDGMGNTIVTGNKNVVDDETISTMDTATFAVFGTGFIAKDIQIRNTAGPEKHQAVALLVASDFSTFLSCNFSAYQDTLYVRKYRQFYRDCWISGTVDFIFGDSVVVIQNSTLVARRPGENQKNALTAQGRTDPNENTGIVIQNCHITGEADLVANIDSFPTYLGRPWKNFSRTVFMLSQLDGLINPAGWLEWDGNAGLKTLQYYEYENSGPGGATTHRVDWPGHKVIDTTEAENYSVENFLGASWLEAAGVQHTNGLTP